MDDKGVEYYSKEVVENLQKGINPKEIIWRENVSNSEAANSQEANNFPPSLNGSGNMNPSQNLVVRRRAPGLHRHGPGGL